MKDLSTIKPTMDTATSVAVNKRFTPATNGKQAFIQIKGAAGCANLSQITGYEGLTIARVTAFGDVAEKLNLCNEYAILRYKAPKPNRFISNGVLVENGVDLQATEVITDTDEA